MENSGGRSGARRFRRLEEAEVLGLTVPVATTRMARLLGLSRLDLSEAPPGLLIPHCRSVHTFGMRFDLELVFLDADRRVVRLHRAVPPSRIVRTGGAHSVLELPAAAGGFQERVQTILFD